MINELSEERRVFECWAHAAAYLPFADYRYYLSRMRTFYKWKPEDGFRRENRQLIGEVRQRVRKEGPLTASDFDHEAGERGPWWDWKPAKRAWETILPLAEIEVAPEAKQSRVLEALNILRKDEIEKVTFTDLIDPE
jgi:uncharacterized protein YcaQ